MSAHICLQLQHTTYDIFLGRLWAWPIVRLVLHLSLECLGNAVYEVPSVKGRCHREPFPNATGAGFRPCEGLEDDKMQSIWGAFTLGWRMNPEVHPRTTWRVKSPPLRPRGGDYFSTQNYYIPHPESPRILAGCLASKYLGEIPQP